MKTVCSLAYRLSTFAMDIKLILQSKGLVILSTLLRIIIIRKIYGLDLYVWFVTESSQISILIVILSAGSFDLAYNRLSGIQGSSYLKPLVFDNVSITIVTIFIGALFGFNVFLVVFLLTQRVLNFYGIAFRAQNTVILEREVYVLSSLIKLLLYGVAAIFEIRFNLFLLFLALSDLSCIFYSNRLRITNNTQVSFLQIQKEILQVGYLIQIIKSILGQIT